jgi:hypothetical protein
MWSKHCICTVAGDGAGCLNLGAVPPADAEMPPLQEVVDAKIDVTAQASTAPEPRMDDTEEIVKRIRSGWTIEDANAVSIGELYLMVCTLIMNFFQ